MGKLREARESIAKIQTHSISAHDEAVVSATNGLIAYRTGDINGGRALYGQAVEIAARANSWKTQIMALLNWAREELIVGGADGERLFAAVRDAIEKDKGAVSPDVELVYQRVERLLASPRGG